MSRSYYKNKWMRAAWGVAIYIYSNCMSFMALIPPGGIFFYVYGQCCWLPQSRNVLEESHTRLAKSFFENWFFGATNRNLANKKTTKVVIKRKKNTALLTSWMPYGNDHWIVIIIIIIIWCNRKFTFLKLS